MKRLLPILLCFLAFAVPRLYGQKTYPVTFSAMEGGTVSATIVSPWETITSGRNVSAGLDVNFFAEADEGKQLDYWEINGERSDITDYTLATENLQAALDVVAHFKDAPADGYAVHFSVVGDGNLKASYMGTSGWSSTELKDGGMVPAGTRVSFEVVPKGDKDVGHWTINGKKNIENYGKREIIYTVIAESTLSVEIINPTYDKLTYEATEGATLEAYVNYSPVNSGDSVKRGSEVTFTPRFEDAYKLDHWEINGETYPQSTTSVSIEYKMMGETHTKLFARMKDQLAINFSAEANGEVAAFKQIGSGYNASYAEITSGEKVYEESKIFLWAKPSEGYKLVAWTLAGDTIGTTNPLVYKVKEGDNTLVAHFAEGTDTETLPLHFSASEGGKITGTMSMYSPYYTQVPVKDGFPIKKGENVSFKAVPDSLYMVKSWSVNGKSDDYYNGKKEFSHSFYKEDTVYVEFQQFTPRVVTFESATAEGGRVDVKDSNWENIKSGGIVPDGSKISIYAYKNDGYEFEYWEIDGERSSKYEESKIYDYPVTADVNFKAYFKKLAMLPVKFSAKGAGSVTAKIGYWGDPINSGDTIQENTSLRFTARAEEGSKLRNWTINGVDTLPGQTDISYYVRADKENTLIANFVSTTAPKAIVTFTYDGEGALACTDKLDDTVIASGDSVAIGNKLELVATPSTGYTLSGWTINGEELYPEQTTIEYTVVEGTNDIKAHFKEAAMPEGLLVTFSATPNEGGSVTATYFGDDWVRHPFNSGDRVKMSSWLTFTAKANPGYVLEKWIVDGEEEPIDDLVPDQYTHTIKADLVVEAVFKQNAPAPSKVTLTYGVATEGGKLASVLAFPATGDPYAVNSGDEVPYATNLSFQAEADPGYTVEKWTVNGKEDTFAGNDNMLSMAIQENSDVQVYFKKADDTSDGYSVTFAADPFEGGKITATYAEGFSNVDITSGEKVAEGKYVTFIAEANPGYEFEKFTVNGLDAPVDFTQPEKYATELYQDLNVVAIFKGSAPVEEHTVTFVADPTEGGTVTATYYDNDKEEEVPFETGAKFTGDETYLTFTAKAADGYKVVSWIANGEDVTPSNPTKYEHQLKADLDLKVVFKKLYPLTLTATKGGKLVAKAGDKELTSGDNVVEGTTITIEATPETGYELTALTAGSEDILATKSFEMKGATEVKATFTKLQKNYVVTLQSNEHGTISIQEKVDLKAVPEGTKLTVVAKGANDKCELTKLTANGKDILKDKTFTVTEDVTVVAEFVDHTGLEAATTATLSVYPNPAKEYAIVSGLAPESMVALYTLEGQLITRLHTDRSGSLQIDLTALSDGTYLVVTEGAAQRLVVKH